MQLRLKLSNCSEVRHKSEMGRGGGVGDQCSLVFKVPYRLGLCRGSSVSVVVRAWGHSYWWSFLLHGAQLQLSSTIKLVGRYIYQNLGPSHNQNPSSLAGNSIYSAWQILKDTVTVKFGRISAGDT